MILDLNIDSYPFPAVSLIASFIFLHFLCFIIDTFLFSSSDSQGFTATQLAAIHNRVPLLEALLCAGGCPLLCNIEGFSAIDLASQNASDEALHLMEYHLNLPFEEENDKAQLQFCEWHNILINSLNAT